MIWQLLHLNHQTCSCPISITPMTHSFLNHFDPSNLYHLRLWFHMIISWPGKYCPSCEVPGSLWLGVLINTGESWRHQHAHHVALFMGVFSHLHVTDELHKVWLIGRAKEVIDPRLIGKDFIYLKSKRFPGIRFCHYFTGYIHVF